MRPAWLLILLATATGTANAAPDDLRGRAETRRPVGPDAPGARRRRPRGPVFGHRGGPPARSETRRSASKDFRSLGPIAGHPERDDFSDARVGVMQDVPNGRPAAGQRVSARPPTSARPKPTRPAQGREVRLNTALAWIDLFYAERRLAALADIDKALAPLRDAAPSQVASGAMRPAQTLEPEQLTATLGDRRADLVAAVGKARSELVRWTGDADAGGRRRSARLPDRRRRLTRRARSTPRPRGL